MQTETRRLRRFGRFCIAGSPGTIVYYISLYGLTEYLGVWYIASSLVGFFLATGLTFALQKFWTFENREIGTTGRQSVQYFILKVLLHAINTAGLYAMVELLGMWYILAQVILAALLLLNFLATEYIFKSSSGPNRSVRPSSKK